jgi:transposase
MSVMETELLTLSMDELKRAKVLERVGGGRMTNEEGAESLGMTPRQFRRLKARYAAEGAKGLAHRNRGRKPAHAITDEIKLKVRRLYEEKYFGSNFCHYADLLEEYEGIALSEPSVRRILTSAGYDSVRPQRRRGSSHRPRTRRASAGALWQIDATPYEWLGGEYGKFALHAAIDDATGVAVGGRFTRNECMRGYFETMRTGITAYGVPLALYSDRHTIFRSPKEKLTIDEELDGVQVRLSDFGAAMAELGIEHIKAATPQAKGRIERLWETLQGRLPVELRLLGVKDIDGANAALPDLLSRFNRLFAVAPSDGEAVYRPLTANLDCVFTLREIRKIGAGGVITYKGALYAPRDRSERLERRTAAEVRETMSGAIMLRYAGRIVAMDKVEPASKAPPPEKPTRKTTAHKPAADHPWRRRGNRTMAPATVN